MGYRDFPNVCKDCKERYVGCHGNCERYLNAKAMHNTKMEEMYRLERQEDDYQEFHAKAIRRAVNRRRKQ